MNVVLIKGILLQIAKKDTFLVTVTIHGLWTAHSNGLPSI